MFALTLLCQYVWAQNDSLSLSEAIEKALSNNYNLTIAQKDLTISEINNNWGTAGRYPTVTFDVNSNNSRDFDVNVNNRLTAGLGVNWVLFDGFRVTITKQQLDLLEDLSRGSLAVEVENTIEDVILAYYNVLLQKETLEVFRNLMGLSGDRYGYEQKRYEIGGSVTYNVLLAKNEYLADKTMFLRQEIAVRDAIRTLNFLMGEENEVLYSVDGELEADTNVYNIIDLKEKMLSNNQVLKNQYLNVLVRQRQTELRKSDLHPSLRLSTGIRNTYTRNVIEGGDPIKNQSLSPYGDLNFSYELFNGGNRKRAIEIAKINEEIAGVQTARIQHSLSNELMILYDNYSVRLQLLKVANERLQSSELNLKIADEKFKTGAINSFNYRDIQLSYLNAALDRLGAVYDLLSSHTFLTRITGGFLSVEK